MKWRSVLNSIEKSIKNSAKKKTNLKKLTNKKKNINNLASQSMCKIKQNFNKLNMYQNFYN
jgi:hypothetical protein